MEQILDAYNFINKVFTDNYLSIKKVNAPFLEKEELKPSQSSKKKTIKIKMSNIKNFPNEVTGTTSPYPTVVRVTTAQYIDSGILSKPFCWPSIIYINVPSKTIINATVSRKTKIFGLEDRNATCMV